MSLLELFTKPKDGIPKRIKKHLDNYTEGPVTASYSNFDEYLIFLRFGAEDGWLECNQRFWSDIGWMISNRKLCQQYIDNLVIT